MEEWTRLALAARGGDERHVTAFVRAVQADVWRLCARLGDVEHADDLTQETLLRVLRALPGYRGDAPVRAWLVSILRRVVADDIALRQRRRRLPDPTAPVVAPDPTGRVDLEILLARLPEERRQAFWLTQVAGYSYADAARLCDCPVGTIRSRVARARDELVLLLAPDTAAG